jgi:hypothetical protein
MPLTARLFREVVYQSDRGFRFVAARGKVAVNVCDPSPEHNVIRKVAIRPLFWRSFRQFLYRKGVLRTDGI